MGGFISRVSVSICIGALVVSTTCAWGQARTGTGQGQMRAGGQSYSGSTVATSISQRAALKGDALIQYDVDTGTLIVVTDEETNEQIGKVVEALDLPVPEVLIKVVFLEITHTNSLDLGADITYQHTHTDADTGRVDSQILQSIFGAATQTTGGIYSIAERDLNATIEALSEMTKLEVLSRPSILAKNNKQATITIGQSIPLVANSRVTDTGQTINTLTYQDVGIILDVTPHILENNCISLDVAPQISQLTGQTVPVTDTATEPIISMRAAQTSVVVPDGSTVIIGGLMEDNKTKDAKKVPLLGDIPVLGNLFKRRNDSKTKTELVIFLTPHVVQSADALAAVSASERGRLELVPKVFSKEEMDRYLEPKTGGDAIPPANAEARPASKVAPTPAAQESKGQNGKARRKGKRGKSS